MNPFFFEKTDKEKVLNINEVKDQIIEDFFRKGIRLITINDSQFDNIYQIRLEQSNIFGTSGLCFLDKRPSNQADFKNGGHLNLKTVVNKIAGGEII